LAFSASQSEVLLYGSLPGSQLIYAYSGEKRPFQEQEELCASLWMQMASIHSAAELDEGARVIPHFPDIFYVGVREYPEWQHEKVQNNRSTALV
jgi:hypothetical protein